MNTDQQEMWESACKIVEKSRDQRRAERLTRWGKVLGWSFQNLILMALVCLALYAKSEGAGRVLIFLSWLSLLLSTFVLISPEARKGLRSRGRAVPASFDAVFVAGMTILLIWHGWWITAGVFALSALLHEAAHEEKPGSAANLPCNHE